MVGQAGTQTDLENNCVDLKIDDFLDAQGTQSTFFPPVPNYVGWTGTAPTFENFALVDYAGVADKYVQGQGGPRFGSDGRWLRMKATSKSARPLMAGRRFR